MDGHVLSRLSWFIRLRFLARVDSTMATGKQNEQDGSPTVNNQSHGAQPKHGNALTTVKANQQIRESRLVQ